MEGKYVARRFFLIFLLILLIGGGCTYVGYQIASSNIGDDGDRDASSQPESDATPVSSSEEASSEPEPESQADEPVAEPVDKSEWNLLLVNKQNMLPDDFMVELEKVVDDFRVDKRIKDPLLRLFAAAKEDGIVLMVCSAYRAPEYQEQLFSNKKTELMAGGMGEQDAIAATATIITYPGTSEHHTGLAVDIVTPSYQNLDDGFEKTPAFEWLDAHAAEYGFILRYPKDKQDITEIIYEPWHYRYVGIDHALAIKEKGQCLEEYLNPVLDDLTEPDESEEEASGQEEETE
jgi:D-alanyl-D-alanine carboxypeptidase